MSETTAIQPFNLAMRFGSENDLQNLLHRIATLCEIDADMVAKYPDVRATLLQAASYWWMYGAIAKKDFFLLPFKKEVKTKDAQGRTIVDYRTTYTISDSYQWRVNSANITVKETGRQYYFQTIEVPEEETEKRLKRLGLVPPLHGPYHPNDVLHRSRVYFEEERDDIRAGRDIQRYWHWGAWRQNAKLVRDGNAEKWIPDTIPYGRDRLWVSAKRGEKSALSEHYPLQPIPGWVQLDDAQRKRRIEDELAEPTPTPADEALDAQIINSPPPKAERTPNGDYYYAS